MNAALGIGLLYRNSPMAQPYEPLFKDLQVATLRRRLS